MDDPPQMTGARVLVTGGAGFIGSHLVQRFASLGADVRVFDNFSTGKRENLDALDCKPELIEGDLRDLAAVRTAVDGMDYVLHEGALGSVPRSIDNPLETNDVNVTGTLHVLLAARDARVRRVVFASSSSIYGDSETLPKVESQTAAPISPYGVSKLAAERYCSVFWHTYRLPTVSLRYFNVFGARQDPTSQYAAVIAAFLDAAVAGREMTIYGDGEQTRDFTHVENVVKANLWALLRPEAPGEILNIAAGERVSVNSLAEQISELLGSPAKIAHVEERAGDIRHSYADITRAKTVIGYAVEVGWKEGLKRTLDWYQRRTP